MRDNGLPASAWAYVGDLEPWLTQAALDALRQAGVAAYSTPHTGHAGAYLDVQLPDRPTDRLYVDVSARERAAAVLAHLNRGSGGSLEPGRSSREVDEAFAEIVAQLQLDGEASLGETDDELGLSGTQGRVVREASGWDDLFAADEVPRSEARDRDSEERFIPPHPPPVPRGTPLRRLAWFIVIGAPLAVLVCMLVSYRLNDWVGLLVVGSFVAALVTLFATMGERTDDTDDGAVV